MSTVVLRELQRTDLATINSWRSDRLVVDHLGSPFRHVGPEIDDRWFDEYLASRANNVRLAICVADDSIVGAAYLLNIDWVNRNAEFSIWIGVLAAQGKKIGEAATRLTLDHAFFDLNLERVYLEVLVENKRAIGLYRKIGFRDEGVRRRATFKRGAYRDMLAMALLRDGYAASVSSSGS